MEHGLVHFVLELLKRFYPAKVPKVEPFTEPIDTKLAIKVSKQWTIPTIVLMIVWIGCITYFGGQEAAKLNKYLIQLIYKDAIVLNVTAGWYIILGLFSLTYFQDFFAWFVKNFTDNQTLELLNYGNELQTPYNVHAIMPWLKKAAFIFGLIIFLLGGMTHLRLYKDRFVIGISILYTDKVFFFNQIASITHTQKVHYSNDEDRIRPLIEIKMKDNSTWESNDFDIEKDSFVFRLIAEGANVKIDSVPLIYKPRYH